MAMFDASTGDLVTYLKTQTGITALVGSTTSARIYPVYAKQGAALPFLVFVQSGGDSFRHLSGGSGIRRTALQIYAFAATQAGADALAEQVRLSMANHRGTMGSSTVYDCDHVATAVTGFDEAEDASDSRRYWTMIVFDLYHNETAVANG
ncbi:MAG TPA: DUF3168 domain-containing protein [Pirellulales bacterium]|nr:DUF3168 domain-containing protein [Pirellulales bacterium]